MSKITLTMIQLEKKIFSNNIKCFNCDDNFRSVWIFDCLRYEINQNIKHVHLNLIETGFCNSNLIPGTFLIISFISSKFLGGFFLIIPGCFYSSKVHQNLYQAASLLSHRQRLH